MKKKKQKRVRIILKRIKMMVEMIRKMNKDPLKREVKMTIPSLHLTKLFELRRERVNLHLRITKYENCC
ncbi:hypothetical protein BC833DRAFT_612910 [Globomyces pollinis-pini]|nr:hypothetical protein BC833DRAFT_612910 [Globomyces pollinis-pini]